MLIGGAGFAAGAMNALAGGGSFVSLPALIAAGVPSVEANASSTVALFPGGVASAWAYRDGLSAVGIVRLRSLLMTTMVGGVVGAFLLLRTSSTIFDYLLPWLLLLATIALGAGRRLGEWLRRRWRSGPLFLLVLQFGLGVYGGYFGGAVGIMMVALWGLVDGRDLKGLSAPRTLLVCAANSAAVVIFACAGAVRWMETIVMLLAAIAGGYGGALIGRHAPAAMMRMATLAIAGGITLAFFVHTYLLRR